MLRLIIVGVFTVVSILPVFGQEPKSTTQEISESSSAIQILQNPRLFHLIRVYHGLSDEERQQLHTEMKKSEVREQVRAFLDDPERLEQIRSERPDLHQRITEHGELEKGYWELLKKYHSCTDTTERAELATKIREELGRLEDAEIKRYQGELERLKQYIQRLEKRVKVRLAKRDELIQKRLERDLKELPPPPFMGEGPDRTRMRRGPGRGPDEAGGNPSAPPEPGQDIRRGDAGGPPWGPGEGGPPGNEGNKPPAPRE
ncbi:MAG TPA: hypothetical protein PLG59_20195 [bacterium]|nr:hypothetical protein [bacterium]HQO36993.1 hypothetical protein [bacterium]HQP98998.1 hypothetical protein [bacterium]